MQLLENEMTGGKRFRISFNIYTKEHESDTKLSQIDYESRKVCRIFVSEKVSTRQNFLCKLFP